MTNCAGTPADQLLESYLLGTLPEAEALQFEEHYFDCPVCLAQVEAMQAVAAKLRSAPRGESKRLIPWPMRLAAVGAIAAVLVGGFIVLRTGRSHQQTVATSPQVQAAQAEQPGSATPKTQPEGNRPVTQRVSQLADLTLPVFRLSNLRGEAGNPAFLAGMKAYTAGDCRHAATELATVASADRDSLAARFFGGMCLMHDGNLAGAEENLRAVYQAGDSPQQEAAIYFLAQIALSRNDADAAQKSLESAVALHGDYEGRARAELAHLREAGSR